MAQNISLMGADYSAVPAVDLPKTSGGLARFTDTSASTCSASNMTYGTIGYDANGNPVTGSIIDGDLMSYGTEEKIPAIYQRVEYIVSPGSGAHINTGVPGNDETLEIDLCYEVGKWTAYRGFWGNYYNESSNCWRIIFPNTQNGTLYTYANTRASSPRGVVFGDSFNAISGKKIFVNASYNRVEVTIDGVTKVATPSAAGTENANPIAIGHTSVNSSDTNATNSGAKWYYVKIRSGGELVRWYVPCYRKSDDVVGFYDMINHTFDTSYGRVEFTLE